MVPTRKRLARLAGAAALVSWTVAAAGTVPATQGISGRVVDVGGRPVPQAMVTWESGASASGPAAVTVFADGEGRFRLPAPLVAGHAVGKALGYDMVDVLAAGAGSAVPLTIIMRADADQSGTAPASAWLAGIADPADRSALVLTCVGCHQIPAPEVRRYARSIHDSPFMDAASREQSWRAIVHYMNYLSAWEFGRAGGQAPDAARVYSGGEPGPTAALLARALSGPFRAVEGYHYGAPLLVNERTVIREYAVPRPNAIREAVTVDDPGVLWAADVAANRIVRIDAATGAQRDYEIPSPRLMGPHTLVPGKDGELWVTGFFPGLTARLATHTGRWKVWELRGPGGGPIGVHDLSFDTDHALTTDRRGRIWYSDIGDNAVGWLDPASGKTGIHRVPPVPGRTGNEQLYGLALSADKRHVWYSQVGIGCFGSFNIDTGRFDTVVQLPDRNAGPRRIAMSGEDILYVPLYGAGQLVEYDTRARRLLGTYDLPDRASAPYATVWDPKRKVVWIATSNADAIYRFDPRDKSFAVLPLPRAGAFLRMLVVDRTTGALVTSYANIVEDVRGPRMVVTIDLGDGRGTPAQAVPSITVAAAPAKPASAAAPLAPPVAVEAAQVPALLQKHRCVACHDEAAQLVGPPYTAIALRHAADGPDAAEVLARKILLGGSGNWGVVPMIPNDTLTLGEARVMAEWILTRKPPE